MVSNGQQTQVRLHMNSYISEDSKTFKRLKSQNHSDCGLAQNLFYMQKIRKGKFVNVLSNFFQYKSEKLLKLFRVS